MATIFAGELWRTWSVSAVVRRRLQRRVGVAEAEPAMGEGAWRILWRESWAGQWSQEGERLRRGGYLADGGRQGGAGGRGRGRRLPEIEPHLNPR